MAYFHLGYTRGSGSEPGVVIIVVGDVQVSVKGVMERRGKSTGTGLRAEVVLGRGLGGRPALSLPCFVGVAVAVVVVVFEVVVAAAVDEEISTDFVITLALELGEGGGKVDTGVLFVLLVLFCNRWLRTVTRSTWERMGDTAQMSCREENKLWFEVALLRMELSGDPALAAVVGGVPGSTTLRNLTVGVVLREAELSLL
jgi:hypothetical protein